MKKYLIKFGAWASTLPILLLPAATYAQLEKSQEYLGDVGTAVGADSQAELPELIGNVIAVFLSVLGIIFVVLIVYAGYMYMTAGGEDDKVKKAKKLLGQAIIGLVIIIAAYSISAFVIDSLVDVAKS